MMDPICPWNWKRLSTAWRPVGKDLWKYFLFYLGFPFLLFLCPFCILFWYQDFSLQQVWWLGSHFKNQSSLILQMSLVQNVQLPFLKKVCIPIKSKSSSKSIVTTAEPIWNCHRSWVKFWPSILVWTISLPRWGRGLTRKIQQDPWTVTSVLEVKVVIPARLERATYCLEGSCSIQLSYGTVLLISLL